MQKSFHFPTTKRDAAWGLTVAAVGYEEILPSEEPYPPRSQNSALLIYVVEGQGSFQPGNQPETTLHAGDVVMLSSEEQHVCCPVPSVGWNAYWISFSGTQANRIISTAKPVVYVGYSAELIHLFREALQIADTPAMARGPLLLASIAAHIIGLAVASERERFTTTDAAHSSMVQRAKLLIRTTLETPTTIQDIAAEIGTSYSTLRKIFKDHTGLSPATYQQQLRIERATELLTSTSLTIKQVAYRLHFESPDYFSLKYRQKTGRRPSEIRNQ